MNQTERIQYLAEQLLNQKASQAELEELSGILEMGGEESVLYLEELIAAGIPPDRIPLSEETLRAMSANTLQMDKPEAAPVIEFPRSSFLRRWWWAAASVILLAGIGSWLWINHHQSNTGAIAKKVVIPPGKSGAILTLADGQQVSLDSAGNGLIAVQEGAKAMVEDGKLAYRKSDEKSTTVVYNTMSTPRGREFRLMLPDGSQVWLNAASSIRFPTVFAGKDRKVEITGEAYFEVVQNAAMPFMVMANNKAAIQVLGTAFNVNAYDNETSTNTTLLDGAVKVNGTVIKPGQQIQVTETGEQEVLDNVDLDKVMAWKKGQFALEGASIVEIMRQLERWYDIEVVYGKVKPKVELEGKMTRDVSLNGLIVLLEKSGIRLRLEGRKLIVLP